MLIYAALFASQMSVSLLNGLGQGRASFVATLSSSLATVALVVPLAPSPRTKTAFCERPRNGDGTPAGVPERNPAEEHGNEARVVRSSKPR